MAQGLCRSRDGNVALTFALIAPLLLAFVGAGVDYSRYHSLKAQIQEVADAAALAGARQFLMSKEGDKLPDAIARATTESGLARLGIVPQSTFSVSGDNQSSTVNVIVTYAMRPSFLVSVFKNPINVNVASSAQASGGTNICVISLDDSARESILMTGTAKLSGRTCAVFANSNNATAVGAYNSARMLTAFTCSSGGYGGAPMNYDPLPLTDCPVREDPFAGRVAPTVGACDYSKFSVKDFVGVLQPGVYCGGLAILGNSRVEFAPGIYVIKDGDMEVLGTSSISGDNIGFYFVGNGADLFLYDQVDVQISGPVSGVMAGILIWQEPSGKTAKVFEVASNNVKKLVGTIYIPNGKFLARADAPVAQSSAYTAIVAKKIELLSGVNLVLNTNYDQTPVPVPNGIGGSGSASVKLRR
jgi:Flp pilus assembly protein TadG